MSRLCLRSSSLIATKFAPRNDQYNRWGQRWKTKTREWDRRAHHHLAIALDAVAAATGSGWRDTGHIYTETGGAPRPLIAAKKFAMKRGRSMSMHTSTLCRET